MEPLVIFCRQVRSRSAEHREAVRHLMPAGTFGAIVGILRQEIDSMVRVIYLLSVTDRERRRELLARAVAHQPWLTKGARVTDREMVELADKLQGWTKSVYRFGCAFIHLSAFHDYAHRDPLAMIPDVEREAILAHMRYYHGGPTSNHPSFETLGSYLPSVFEKIASNLEHYVKELEGGLSVVEREV